MLFYLIDVLFLLGRINGAQFLAVHLDVFGVDHDGCTDGRNRAPIDPGVQPTAVDEDVAGLQMHDLTAFEFAVKLTGQLDTVVHGFGAVRESRSAGSDLVDAERRAPAGAHIIRDFVLDETRPLSGVSGRRIVDRHLISRPQLPARDAGDPSRNSRDQLIGLNDGYSTVIVTSHDASYF